MTNTTIRNILRNAFGARKYRITRDGEIHVHGTMPNTSQTGWYLFGRVGNAETESRLSDYA